MHDCTTLTGSHSPDLPYAHRSIGRMWQTILARQNKGGFGVDWWGERLAVCDVVKYSIRMVSTPAAIRHPTSHSSSQIHSVAPLNPVVTIWGWYEIPGVFEAGTHVLCRAWLTWTSPLRTTTQASRGPSGSSGMRSGGGTDSQAGM